jgi:hypothetical protein
MAFVKQFTLARNPQDWGDFFRGLNYATISTIDNEIMIGEVFRFEVIDTGNIFFYVNGEEVEVPNNPLIDANGSFITIACSDGFVWLAISSFSNNNKTLMLFYEIVEERHLYAYKFSSGVRFADIGNLNAVDDEELYFHSKRLNFLTVTGFIKFTQDILFQVALPNNIRIGIDPNFYACTTIAENQLVTFGMVDYYALTSNILIPLDMEESEG